MTNALAGKMRFGLVILALVASCQASPVPPSPEAGDNVQLRQPATEGRQTPELIIVRNPHTTQVREAMSFGEW